jgi:hypothetical protein
MALRLHRVRLEVLEAVVFQGHAQPAGANAQGRQDDSSAHLQHRGLLSASGDQRDERGTQQPDSEDHEHWPTGSETSRTSRLPSTSTAAGSISTHAEPGSAELHGSRDACM